MSEALISKDISNWKLFTKKSYVSDKRAPIPSSKCMFIMPVKPFHVTARLNILSRVHFSKVWQWFRLTFSSLLLPPPPRSSRNSLMLETLHVANSPHVLKNQCQHPSKCLAEFRLHGRHHPFLQYWSPETCTAFYKNK